MKIVINLTGKGTGRGRRGTGELVRLESLLKSIGGRVTLDDSRVIYYPMGGLKKGVNKYARALRAKVLLQKMGYKAQVQSVKPVL